MLDNQGVIVIAADCSGSMASAMDGATRLGAVQNATVQVVDSLVRTSPATKMGLITFNHVACPLLAPLAVGEGQTRLLHAIACMSSGGGTAFRPALEQARAMFFPQHSAPTRLTGLLVRARSLLGIPSLNSIEEAVGGGRRILLFLSDGQDGQTHPVPVAEQLQSLGVEVHTVGVGQDPSEVDECLMRAMASWDDGTSQKQYRFIKDAQMLAEHFVQVSSRLIVRV